MAGQGLLTGSIVAVVLCFCLSFENAFFGWHAASFGERIVALALGMSPWILTVGPVCCIAGLLIAFTIHLIAFLVETVKIKRH